MAFKDRRIYGTNEIAYNGCQIIVKKHYVFCFAALVNYPYPTLIFIRVWQITSKISLKFFLVFYFNAH